MKNFKSPTLLSFLLLFALGFTSCDNDSFSGEVDMTFNLAVDGEAFQTGTTYTLNGTAVEFTNFGFYIGGISFAGEEAESVFQDKYLLVTPDNTNFTIGELSKDTYSELSFFVGVDPATNSMSTEDFTTRASSDPLAANDFQMHWNWNSGYKFLRVDGMSDTDGDGVVDTGITYHIGSDALLEYVNLNLENLSEEVNIEFDFAKLFAGVDFTTDIDTHTGNNLPLAQKLVANYSTAFSLK
ncbi:MAG: MbnP family protein [Saprospiraceae bacterium]